MRSLTTVTILLLLASHALADDKSPTPVAESMHARHLAVIAATDPLPKEPGQAAFAAIAEIVAMLEADSATDWPKVDIEALRQHLIDMNNVTLGADVVAARNANGIRYAVTGGPPVAASIRRMIAAHAVAMDGARGWTYRAEQIERGAALTVTAAEAKDLVKLEALGFIGLLTVGMHHQAHHLMIAKGGSLHQ